MRPLIGITSSPQLDEQRHGTFRRYCLSNTYTRAVERAGGIPVILPLHLEDIDALLDRLDGIIFSGGGDIAASNWNADQSDKADTPDEERDTFEINAVKRVVARDLPMLGICRGLQSINVALGGSLYQDIATEFTTDRKHRQQDDGKQRDTTSDTVIVQADSPLATIVGSDPIEINSFHHQALKDVSPRLSTIASSDDGIVEACSIPEMTFGLGLQWHPEMRADDDPRQQAIFDAFVRAAIAYQARR